jgi:hypothetical protein
MRGVLSGSMLLMVTLIAAPAWSDSRQNGAERRGSEASVVFTAHDYGFTGPDQIPAGLTTVRIVNAGHDLHHVQFLKLLQGKSAEDFRAAIMADPNHLPNWVQYAGGPNANRPGSLSSATMNLVEGDYVLLCWIPDKKGVPHVALGMQKALFVRGGKPTTVSAPKATTTIKQIDYQFLLSNQIKSGLQTIEVVNHGTQAHEAVLVKLVPGATVNEVVASFEPGASGPPRGELVGGITGIEKGARVYFTGEFESGRYGLICFLPDATTGKPHFLHGMTTEFTVN